MVNMKQISTLSNFNADQATTKLKRDNKKRNGRKKKGKAFMIDAKRDAYTGGVDIIKYFHDSHNIFICHLKVVQAKRDWSVGRYSR